MPGRPPAVPANLMRVRVLGCHGGELPGCRTTCFLLNGHVTIDAGALTGVLPLEQLLAVNDIFLTHSHFDHVKDVPLLTDLLVGKRDAPLRVYGPRECIDTLRSSVFNDELWPDFTLIPNHTAPVLELIPLPAFERVSSGDLTFTSVPVNHPVESVGYLVESGGRAIAFSGDTGPTGRFWNEVNRHQGMQAVFVELSFPNRLQWLADLSGHFTPQTLREELKKLEHDVPILLYHLKPAFLDELRREVAELGNDRLRILELDDEFEF